MSYPQVGYQAYGGPPQGYGQTLPDPFPTQGYPPQQQQAYGAPQGYPPHGQYPPQQHNGYPPQQYQSYPPQQPQDYPPPQQPQGYPPQQQHQPYPPQQPPHGAPSYSPYPQQQPYNAPPMIFNGTPQQQNPPYGGGPPQAPYGAPPSQPYGAPAPMPTPPSPGYAPNHAIQYDALPRVRELGPAMHQWGTDEKVLIRILSQIPATEIPCLKSTYTREYPTKRDLVAEVESETSGDFRRCLHAILRGPLENDVHFIKLALKGYFKGLGTKEDILNDVLVGRSNADIHAIKHAYAQSTSRSLEADIRSDLSLKTERLYMMILNGTRQEDSAPVLPESVKADALELNRAMNGRGGTEQLTVCSILSNRSDGQIRAIAPEYKKLSGAELEADIVGKFSGHMETVLVEMVRCGCDRAMRDAMRLEKCMKGGGTEDSRLIEVVTSLHWDRQHMAQVKGAYAVAKWRSKESLVKRIKSDTGGDFEKLLLAMIA